MQVHVKVRRAKRPVDDIDGQTANYFEPAEYSEESHEQRDKQRMRKTRTGN